MAEYIPVLLNIAMLAMLAVGIILTLVGLPGNLFIVLVAVLYGWQEDFVHLTYGSLLTLAGLWLIGELVDFIAGIMGAKKEQASWKATTAAFFGALIGGIIGTGILPVIGTIIGSVIGGFLSSYCVEYINANDKMKALQVAKGVVKGQLLGMLIKFVVAISMSMTIIYKLWF